MPVHFLGERNVQGTEIQIVFKFSEKDKEDLLFRDLDLHLSLVFLRMWGWWPGVDWTPLQMRLYQCHRAFSLGALLLFVLSEILALFDRSNSLDAHLANACLLMEFAVSFVKVMILHINLVPLRRLISKLSSMHLHHGRSVPQQSDILKGAAWKGNLTTASFLVLGSSSCMVWFLYPFIYSALTDNPCLVASPTINNTSEQRSNVENGSDDCVAPQALPADSWFPFDISKDPGYKMAYAFQILSIHIGCVCTSCTDTLYVTMFIYITAQLRILNLSIKNVRKMVLGGEASHPWFEDNDSRGDVSEDAQGTIDVALSGCIKHHQDIISCVKELQDIISISLLCQVVTSMCVICLTLFSVVVGAQDAATTLKFTTYLLTMFAQLFLVCWFGDDIIRESLEVYNSAFHCDWPDGSRVFKQRILMLILRAQRPLAFTAGKFYVMSRSTYLQIVQASYSVFTVLSNVKDEAP